MASEKTACVSRRDFLKVGAAGAALCAAGCGLLGTGDAAKQKVPIGLQLYSVRTECEKDLPRVISEVGKMGYAGVEFAGYYNRSAKDLRALLDGAGLKCCGTHTGIDTLLGDNLKATIEFNQTLGNKYLIVPWLPDEKFKTAESCREAAKLLNEISEKAKPHGMRVGYHNHSHEFKPLEGQTPWDFFFSAANPDVIMQFDTGNALGGGGEALTFLKRYPGRATTVHVKEFSKANPKALIGEGDIEWAKVFEVCETVGGTEWYIVEYESDAYPPLESVKRCLDNLRKMGK